MTLDLTIRSVSRSCQLYEGWLEGHMPQRKKFSLRHVREQDAPSRR
jgi:hypothetical protein